MIVPMNKITLLALESDKECVLKKLKKAGVVHVEKMQGTSETLNKLVATEKDLNVAKNLLAEFVSKNKKGQDTKNAPSPMSYEETLTFASGVLSLCDEHKDDIARLAKIREELSRCEVWGEFNLKDFELLKEKGRVLTPVEMPCKVFRDKVATRDLNLILVNTKMSQARCLAITADGQLPKDLSPEIKEFTMPTVSTYQLKEKAEAMQAKIASYDTEMKQKAAYINSLDMALMACTKEIQNEMVRLSMPCMKLASGDSCDVATSLISLSGYVPHEKTASVKALAKENGWGYAVKEPDADDAVPTLLKHNKLVNLISPLTDFLGTLPGYREPDISLWFLIFFGIFFAMIFGDAGYGAVLTVLSGFVAVKTKMAKKPVHTGVYMFLYLGLMTVVWGTLVCNWFGLDPQSLPSFFHKISWERISSITHEGVPIPSQTQDRNLMHLAFTLGFVQLVIAHLVGVARNIKSLKFLGDVGSLGMLTGMYFVVLSLVVKMPAPFEQNYILGLIGVGFLLNFVFSNYETGIGQSIVESLKNIINMLLGVVNVFADIMSYIRLWAVGLAGGAISKAVNEMAGPTLTGALIVAGIAILLFGHGLNYAMNILSVIVHGVRLNTLEFSNHLGLTWSGFKYEPFNE